jgi:hypothetical protein
MPCCYTISPYKTELLRIIQKTSRQSRRRVLQSVRLSGELQKYLVPHDALRTAIRHTTNEIRVLVAAGYFARCVLCERRLTTVGNFLEGHQSVRLSWFVCLPAVTAVSAPKCNVETQTSCGAMKKSWWYEFEVLIAVLLEASALSFSEFWLGGEHQHVIKKEIC